MSFLYRELPDCICVDGKLYPIRTGASVWMQVDDLMADGRVPFPEKAAKLIALTLSGRELPPKISETLSALFDFYRCGKAEKGQKEKNNKKRILSFEADAALIYAAFLSCYGVDLSREDPHWFLFCAMLEGVTQTTRLCEVLGIRATNTEEIKDKQLKRRMTELKRRYQLEDLRSAHQVEEDTAAVVAEMM